MGHSTINIVLLALLSLLFLSAVLYSFTSALSQTGLKILDERRVQFSLTFAKNTLKHPQHSRWFVKQTKNEHINTRSAKSIFVPVKARTQRLQKSPIAYLTQHLKDDAPNKTKQDTRQNKTKQDKTRQNKTKQDKTKQSI